jgi:hypothetical protein
VLWLKSEIADGLQRLISLRLRNAPSSDTVTATAVVWYETVASRPISWDERLDRKRIKTAFSELCATVDSFPAPAQFLRALPPRQQALCLPAPTDNKITQQNKKLLDDLMRKLKKENT